MSLLSFHIERAAKSGKRRERQRRRERDNKRKGSGRKERRWNVRKWGALNFYRYWCVFFCLLSCFTGFFREKVPVYPTLVHAFNCCVLRCFESQPFSIARLSPLQRARRRGQKCSNRRPGLLGVSNAFHAAVSPNCFRLCPFLEN